MSFSLDTNVVSESTQLRPNAVLMTWLNGVEENSVFLSVITLTSTSIVTDFIREETAKEGDLGRELKLFYSAEKGGLKV
jgi:hypothetical protein